MPPRISLSRSLCSLQIPTLVKYFSSASTKLASTPISDLVSSRPQYGAKNQQTDKDRSKVYRSLEKQLTQIEDSNRRRQTIEAIEQSGKATDMERLVSRRWKSGDVYAPHDLSSRESQKWRIRRPPTIDAFDALNLNPISEYKNFAMIAEYTTEMGRIKHHRETGLRPKNQRRVAKAIRRAIGIGLMPSVHKHPELLEMSRMDRSGRMRWLF